MALQRDSDPKGDLSGPTSRSENHISSDDIRALDEIPPFLRQLVFDASLPSRHLTQAELRDAIQWMPPVWFKRLRVAAYYALLNVHLSPSLVKDLVSDSFRKLLEGQDNGHWLWFPRERSFADHMVRIMKSTASKWSDKKSNRVRTVPVCENLDGTLGGSRDQLRAKSPDPERLLTETEEQVQRDAWHQLHLKYLNIANAKDSIAMLVIVELLAGKSDEEARTTLGLNEEVYAVIKKRIYHRARALAEKNGSVVMIRRRNRSKKVEREEAATAEVKGYGASRARRWLS